MIGTISPLVQEAPIQWRRSTALHLLGSLAGGTALFSAVAVGGYFTLGDVPAVARLAIAAISVLILAGREIGLLRWQLPRIHRSVPQSWWLDIGPDRASVAYGFVLGLGVTTVIPVGTYYALLIWTLVVANPQYGAMLGAVYGITRAAPPIVAGRAIAANPTRRTPHTFVVKIAESIEGRRRTIQTANGLAEAWFAGALLAVMVLFLWT